MTVGELVWILGGVGGRVESTECLFKETLSFSKKDGGRESTVNTLWVPSLVLLKSRTSKAYRLIYNLNQQNIHSFAEVVRVFQNMHSALKRNVPNCQHSFII